jgi:hypothetical protein
MQKFHKNFPFGRGMWIWYLNQCEGGSIQRIIDKCKKYNISYVMVKCGDGENTWPQWNKELVERFHAADIKIYAWMFNWGKNPLREGAIACWALDMGADGFIFDAEGEWENLPDPAGTAKLMLELVRKHAPDAFLAHSPLPIIDLHKKFPYVEFGKYCDAVMPQLYYGAMNRTPENVIMWSFQQWSKWEKIWKEGGHEDSIKPIIPAGQTYDIESTATHHGFKCTPGILKAFMDGIAAYGSVNFWSWQHTVREDLWEAIRDSDLKDLSGGKPVEPVEPKYEHGSWHDDPDDGNRNKRWWCDADGHCEFLPFGQTDPTPPPSISTPEPEQPAQTSSDLPKPAAEPQPVITPDQPKHEPELPARVELPADGSKVSVEVREDKNSPNGIEVKVKYHKTHLDMFLELLALVTKLLGGDKK